MAAGDGSVGRHWHCKRLSPDYSRPNSFGISRQSLLFWRLADQQDSSIRIARKTFVETTARKNHSRQGHFRRWEHACRLHPALEEQRQPDLGATARRSACHWGGDLDRIYEDLSSFRYNDRPGLVARLKAIQPSNILVIWKLDRLGQDLKHLIIRIDIPGRVLPPPRSVSRPHFSNKLQTSLHWQLQSSVIITPAAPKNRYR